jgi:hypothetical protein
LAVELVSEKVMQNEHTELTPSTSPASTPKSEPPIQQAGVTISAPKIQERPASPSQPMALKLRRSQRVTVTGKVIFVLDARIGLNAEEHALIKKYRLGGAVVYDSQARKKHQETAYGHFDEASVSSAGRGWWKNARGLASAAMMALSLRITVDDLMNGQTIQCKDLDELLGAEAAILNACKTMKAYLETAQTFDGREEVIEF